MYTYESFVTNGSFTLLRPIYLTLLITSISLLILMLLPKTKRLMNGFSIISISLICSVLAIQLVFYDAIITDEINLSGDSFSTIAFLLIIAFSFFNIVYYFSRNKKKQ